jgi:hypothetical protein
MLKDSYRGLWGTNRLRRVGEPHRQLENAEGKLSGNS